MSSVVPEPSGDPVQSVLVSKDSPDHPECAGCGTSIIEGEMVNLDGDKFHRACWKCQACDQPITEKHFVQTSHGSKPMCMNCHTQAKPMCAVCGWQIDEAFLPVDGKTYHQDCFKCNDCGEKITSGKFCKRDDKFLCETCDTVYAPKCAGCKQPIWVEHTMCDGMPFHRECFKCATCEGPIDGAHGRRRGDTLPVCQKCKAEEAPKCEGCKQPVSGPHLNVAEFIFHSDCFACNDCKQAITGQYFQRGSHFLCQSCEDSRAPQCGHCKKPIWTEHPTINGVPLHYECFLCSTCACRIEGSYFPADDGKPLCTSCHEGKQPPPPECGGCRKPVTGERIHVQGKIYHAGCFTCDKCKKPLSTEGGEAQCHPKNGGHLCADCLHADRTLPMCPICETGIDGQILRLEDKTYHPSCFKCHQCSSPIVGTFTQEVAGPLCVACQPKCELCGDELAGHQCVRLGEKRLHAECHKNQAAGLPVKAPVKQEAQAPAPVAPTLPAVAPPAAAPVASGSQVVVEAVSPVKRSVPSRSIVVETHSNVVHQQVIQRQVLVRPAMHPVMNLSGVYAAPPPGAILQPAPPFGHVNSGAAVVTRVFVHQPVTIVPH